MVRLAWFVATLILSLNSRASLTCTQLDRSFPVYSIMFDQNMEIATLTVSGRGAGTKTTTLYCRLVPGGSPETPEMTVCDSPELSYRAIVRDTLVDVYDGVTLVKRLHCTRPD